jgi:hypothetical protein
MSVLGVIPAAGEGSRWGGYLKEFLPIDRHRKVIDTTLQSMHLGGVENFLVVTNNEKIAIHSKYLSKHYENVSYVLQAWKMDIWGAMLTSLPFAKDYNLFAFPDTIFDRNAFDFNYKNKGHFYLGMHMTDMPERFGVLYNDAIVNKSTILPDDEYQAWGAMIWTKKVAKFWLDYQYEYGIENYTDAMNIAIDEFGYEDFNLGKYTDFASWTDYQKFIKGID